MKAKKIHQPALKPQPLPAGVRLGIRPQGIEYQTRGDGIWIPVVENLKVLDREATIQIDIVGMEKKKIFSIKNSIKFLARKMGFNQKIKFAILQNTLHLWSD